MAGTGFSKELRCSTELREFTGKKRLSRGQMTKAIWAYIKRKKLQDPEDKRVIVPDKALAVLLGKKPVQMFAMTKILSGHLVDEEKSEKKVDKKKRKK